MNVFLPRPPKDGSNQKVTAVKRSVISNLRGVPLHQIAETLIANDKEFNDGSDSSICSHDHIDPMRKREKDKKEFRKAGGANVQATQRIL